MVSCNIVFDSQMLIVGGIPENFVDSLNCDSREIKGQHGLLLGQGENATWQTLMPNVESYLVPGIITSVVGGGYVRLFGLLSGPLMVEQVIGTCHGDPACRWLGNLRPVCVFWENLLVNLPLSDTVDPCDRDCIRRRRSKRRCQHRCDRWRRSRWCRCSSCHHARVLLRLEAKETRCIHAGGPSPDARSRAPDRRSPRASFTSRFFAIPVVSWLFSILARWQVAAAHATAITTKAVLSASTRSAAI